MIKSATYLQTIVPVYKVFNFFPLPTVTVNLKMPVLVRIILADGELDCTKNTGVDSGSVAFQSSWVPVQVASPLSVSKVDLKGSTRLTSALFSSHE